LSVGINVIAKGVGNAVVIVVVVTGMLMFVTV